MKNLTILLAEPRGFCAGVVRAIQTVEAALARYGSPVYVRHEIVHNQTVVDDLKAKGAIFVENLSDVPTDRPVVLSAHGVSKSVIQEACLRGMNYIDAACPMVTKVHSRVAHLHSNNFEIILIGHKGHVEVDGTLGQLPPGSIHLVDTVDDARSVLPRQTAKLAYVTQTTLSSTDVDDIVSVLKCRFPEIQSPNSSDICYATDNRQTAVKEMVARGAEVVVVVGARNSSNSRRLVEVALASGCRRAFLAPTMSDVPWEDLDNPDIIGLTAGASAPEEIVQEVLTGFRQRFNVTTFPVTVAEENLVFNLPKALR